ncbi:uncharacterized protein JN550_010065 [Neoarthrinium moseri]|uniref:uncharacterized protein n=1 Tax=Neoarthrinium moseri TaxID=1658444 RepID=UPI001FDE6BA9|nr:uncharacterized protein JN550_010065 [Neoarthrinium moseri]KAI1862728.1 hypothetical protein JN550_010065 [Neoarthrinium moseri]
MAPARIMQISGAPDPGYIAPSEAHHDNKWYNQDFDGYRIAEQPLFTRRRLRVVCVGAGAAGLQLAYKAERALENIELQIYDKNSDVGGTWLENRYPGCTCDIPSHSYQYTWARNPNWSAYYSSSEEIWQYFKDVAVKYDLEKYVQLNTRVQSATWDEAGGKWRLKLLGPKGKPAEDDCDILVSASGVLNSWKYPDIPGSDVFKGKLMHSAQWDQNFKFDENVRVAVIGGGSSSVQIVPSLQPMVKKLTAFLRSPVWVTTGFGAKHAGPGGTNFTYTEEQKKSFNEDPGSYIKYCRDVEGELNKRFNLMHLNSEDQNSSRQLIASIMAEKINDEKLTKRMVPKFALGCRRMTPGSGYLESLTKDNVEVVHESVVRLTETGVVDESGIEHEVDVVVCATGFDTSFTPHFKVTGRKGADIKGQFGDFPRGYLGIAAENFPNLFRPSSPASHGSILPILEWYTRYMFQVVDKMQTENIKSFEPKAGAIKDFYNHTHELMKRLAWSAPCRSWFKNGNIHGPVTAIYPGSRLHWFEMLRNVRWEDYEIEYRTGNRFQFMGNGFSQVECDPDADPVWYFDDPFTQI